MPVKKATNRKKPAKRSKAAAAGRGRKGRKSSPPVESSYSVAQEIAAPPSLRELPVYEMREARAVEARESDAEVFDAARSQWLTADWDALAGWHLSEFANHPKRARIALLVAAALHEVGDYDGSKEALRQAVEWGAQRRDLINVVIGQAHAALGRARLVAKEFDRAERHFLACITSIAPNKSAARYAKDRVFKELVALGWLPDAQELLKHGIQELGRSRAPSSSELSIFATKVELLSHELSLAIQRRQIGPLSKTNAPVSQSSDHTRLQQLKDLKSRSCSQLGQDLWVLEKTDLKRGGYFVEFGATDGVLLSNTYLLEKEFGWSGLCAEPNPEFLDKLRKNRSCVASADCIAGESGRQVEFLLADEYGGITNYLGDGNDQRRKGYLEMGKIFRTRTISLDAFLRKHKAPRTIDYLSIDTEGSEYEILKNFPFDEWEVRLITVEHNFTPMRQSIRELLTAKGYVCQEAQWDDWYELAPAGNRG
jgi:FkbM family methyltransferase